MGLTSRLQNRHKITALVLFALCLGLATFERSQAHSYLVQSEPADNSVLTEPPKEIRLWFSEAFVPELSSVRVVDLNGNAIQPLSSGVDASDPTLMVVEMPPLPEGLYTVNWSALSAVDGHPARGFFVFSVEQNAGAASGAASIRRPGVLSPAAWLEAGLRSANYLALMLAVGCVGILLWVLPAGALIEAGIAGIYTSARRRVFALTTVAAAGAFTLGLAQMAWQARLLAENLPQGTPVFQLAGQLALQWPWGVAWAGRQIAWLAFFALAVWGWRVEKAEATLDPQSVKSQKARAWLLAVLAVAASLCQSFSSHAAALERPATPLLVDALHLIVAGLWVGGLAALAVGLLPLLLRDRTGFNDLARRIWGPFSRLAAVSVGLLFASGLYSTAHEVISADALLLSPYGKLLSSKVALVLLAGAVGLLNSTLLHPQLSAPLRRVLHKPAGWTPVSMQRFPQLVMIEVCLGLVIVGLVGFLTSQPPAENIAYALSPEDQPADAFQLVNDLFVTLTIKPNRPGTNVVLINVANTRRPPPAEILRVIVRMTYLEKDVGVISQDAELTGTQAANNSYRLATRSLTQPGHWSIEVIVRRKGLPDSRLTVPWTVLAVEDTGPVRISRSRWQNALAAMALGLGILVVALALLAWKKGGKN